MSLGLIKFVMAMIDRKVLALKKNVLGVINIKSNTYEIWKLGKCSWSKVFSSLDKTTFEFNLMLMM